MTPSGQYVGIETDNVGIKSLPSLLEMPKKTGLIVDAAPGGPNLARIGIPAHPLT